MIFWNLLSYFDHCIEFKKIFFWVDECEHTNGIIPTDYACKCNNLICGKSDYCKEDTNECLEGQSNIQKKYGAL